jgi:hypothetical protein
LPQSVVTNFTLAAFNTIFEFTIHFVTGWGIPISLSHNPAYVTITKPTATSFNQA